MEYNSYQLISENSASLNTGSYLNQNEYNLFVKGFSNDFWYGFSENDIIELGIYDRDQNFINWGTLNRNKEYQTKYFSYLNELNLPTTYSYSELQSDFILYKNEKILVSPPQQLSESFNIEEGSYILTYNFTREMAGTAIDPLVIKEISPSKKEIKLLPLKSSTKQYDSFCKKNILLKNVSPLYLKLTNQCPYGQIYQNIASSYKPEIETLKNIFFLTTDGDVINFLRNLYEDVVIYINTPTDSNGNIIGDPDRISRTQGIKTYFSNYLQSNSELITNFNSIDNTFYSYVSSSINRKFQPLGKKLALEYQKTKIFVYNFFTLHFYNSITTLLTKTYNEKYYSYFKNALNVGNGRLLPIINHDYLDERIEDTDPLTLIIKLQNEIPSDIMAGTNGWISNISLTPYIIPTIIRSNEKSQLVSIGPPNFSTDISTISTGHLNKSYTANDLQYDYNINRELEISKKLIDFNIDYNNFSNFIIFSSAQVRLNIFKNKIIQLFNYTSSLTVLNKENINYISNSNSTYPNYINEYDTLQGQISNIVNSFDGYESYLYRNNKYQYSGSNFLSQSYVDEMDLSASYYDKYNRDSLINNTPNHIVYDEDNNDYIVFLTMMGQFFDQFYIYISNLPSSKTIGESSTENFTRAIVNYMLEMFGWNLDNTLEQNDVLTNYLTSKEISNLNSLSSEDIVKIIRNRILLNLPQIYKTKGVEESAKMLLLCYGIPTSLLSIREYGGVNYADENATYTQTERVYMYQFDTSSIYDHFRTEYPGKIKTIEYKFSIPSPNPYSYNKKFIQWGVVETGSLASSISGSGFIHGGFIRERGKNLGKVFFSVGYKGQEKFTVVSNPIPIFDGNIYSVMIRKNYPDPYFEYSSNENNVPIKYDLYVKRNDSGRAIIESTSSYINYVSQSNYLFDNSGYLMIGGWFYPHNNQGYTGTFDKLLLWLDPISNNDFETHVNNINSYAFSGSRDGYKSLVYRMHTDYPFDLRQFAPGTSGYFYTTSSKWWGNWNNASLYYAESASSFTRFITETLYTGSYKNFLYLTSWDAWSGSSTIAYNTNSCTYYSQSIYPYQFKVIDYPCTSIISKYGPNRFRNEKIKHLTQSFDTRFDINNRSTYTLRNKTAPDSNLIGFFADPQEFKNRDIVRYFGNYDFMDTIGNPAKQFDYQYDTLKTLREKYASIGNNISGSNPRFNEMLNVYKLYFNRSVFESIKNLVPARSNVLTGILIEPTILERPKYQRKPIESQLNSGSSMYFDVTPSRYFRETNTKILRLSQSILHAEFNMNTASLDKTAFDVDSLPQNNYINLDLSYIHDPIPIYPTNYLDNEFVSDLPDKYQLGHFPQLNKPLLFDMNYDTYSSGSNKIYLLKQWNTYKIYYKANNWVRTDNPRDNLYSTNSIQLHKYIAVSEDWFKTIAFTENTVTYTPDIGIHYEYTFRNTPNMTKNNLKADNADGHMGWNIYMTGDGSHLEIVSGLPRNHYTHKSQLFSPYSLIIKGKDNNLNMTGSLKRSKQTIATTIGNDGLEDGTPPFESFEVSDVNVKQSDNVIN